MAKLLNIQGQKQDSNQNKFVTKTTAFILEAYFKQIRLNIV
jgi:hypothetical protein